MPCCNNSANEMRIITPAENPIIIEINFLLGSLTIKVIKLPIVVDNPAIEVKMRAYNKVSIVVMIPTSFFICKTNIVALTYETAEPIYAAIMTDTGSFRFERTTPEIHEISAELLKIGVNPGEVYDKIYDQSKFSKIKLFGKAVNSMKLYGDDSSIGYMRLTRKDFNDTEAIESDTDGFVNVSLSIENVKLGLLFLELKEGFKVSFRSKGTIPVNKLAAEFGGGGHINAAGLRIRDGNIEEFIPKILVRALEYVKQYG